MLFNNYSGCFCNYIQTSYIFTLRIARGLNTGQRTNIATMDPLTTTASKDKKKFGFKYHRHPPSGETSDTKVYYFGRYQSGSSKTINGKFRGKIVKYKNYFGYYWSGSLETMTVKFCQKCKKIK